MYRKWVAIVSGAVSGALGGVAALFAGIGCLYSIAVFATIGGLGIFLEPFITDASQEFDWTLFYKASLVFCGIFAAGIGSLVSGIVLRWGFRHRYSRWGTFYLVLGVGVWPFMFLNGGTLPMEWSMLVISIVWSCTGAIFGSAITLWFLFTTSNQHV
jgi:hypothetical protein